MGGPTKTRFESAVVTTCALFLHDSVERILEEIANLFVIGLRGQAVPCSIHDAPCIRVHNETG